MSLVTFKLLKDLIFSVPIATTDTDMDLIPLEPPKLVRQTHEHRPIKMNDVYTSPGKTVYFKSEFDLSHIIPIKTGSFGSEEADKKCTICGVVKNLGQFYKNGTKYRSACILCTTDKERQRYHVKKNEDNITS